jgi:hypothetical protein
VTVPEAPEIAEVPRVATTVEASVAKSLGANVVVAVPEDPDVAEPGERVPPGLALPFVRVAVGYVPEPKEKTTGTPGWPDVRVAVTVMAAAPAL